MRLHLARPSQHPNAGHNLAPSPHDAMHTAPNIGVCGRCALSKQHEQHAPELGLKQPQGVCDDAVFAGFAQGNQAALLLNGGPNLKGPNVRVGCHRLAFRVCVCVVEGGWVQ